MSLTTRMDVLDLVIQCLQEHEQKLDELLERLEQAVAVAERFNRS